MFSKIKSFIVEVLSEALIASVPALIAYVPDVMAALRAEHSAELKRIREENAARQATPRSRSRWNLACGSARCASTHLRRGANWKQKRYIKPLPSLQEVER
jgi:hypothetical protein